MIYRFRRSIALRPDKEVTFHQCTYTANALMREINITFNDISLVIKMLPRTARSRKKMPIREAAPAVQMDGHRFAV